MNNRLPQSNAGRRNTGLSRTTTITLSALLPREKVAARGKVEKPCVTNLGEAVTNLGEDVTNLGEVVTNLGEAVTNLGEVVTNLGEAVTNLGEAVTNLGEDVTNLGEVVEKLERAPCARTSLAPIDRIAAARALWASVRIAADMIANPSNAPRCTTQTTSYHYHA
jgi:ABC-type transporter Mla subunit MlaD